MKQFLLLFIFIVFCFGSDETKIKEIISVSKISGDFNQTKILKAFKNPIKSYGKFAIYDEVYEQNLTKPFKSFTKVNKNGVYEYKDGEYKKISSNFDGELFINIFTMNFKKLKDNFDYKILFNDGWEIKLLPKGILSQIFSEILINGKKYVQKIVLKESNGDETIYEFFNVK